MSLPLIKLATLAIKQLAKPLANGIKKTVVNNPRYSKAITVPAQGYHRLEQTVRMSLLGWTKKIDVKPLSNEAAVNLGAELLGEFVIFAVAVGTLYAESKRGQYKEQRKEALQNAKLVGLQTEISELSAELSKQYNEHVQLTDTVGKLEYQLEQMKNAKGNKLKT